MIYFAMILFPLWGRYLGEGRGNHHTCLVSHPGQCISPHWDCFKAGSAGNQRPSGLCSSSGRLCPCLGSLDQMALETMWQLLCARCQKHMLKNRPGPPSTGFTNHLPPWDKGRWPPTAATEPWEGQPSSLWIYRKPPLSDHRKRSLN